MRIALVSPYDFAYPGGVSEHVGHLGAALRNAGHRADVYAPSSAPGRSSSRDFFFSLGPPRAVRANGSVARIALSPTACRRLAAGLRSGGYDLVHLHEPLVPPTPLLALLRSPAVVVGTFHAGGTTSRGYRWAGALLRPFFGRLRGRIAVSAAARDFVARYFPAEYRVIPNGVDIAAFRAAGGALPPAGSPLVLFAGRIERRKGLGYLLHAWAEVRRRIPAARLVVVGDGPLLARSRRAVERRGWNEVRFRGVVEAEELRRLYGQAALLCAPSTGQESFGLVVLQALAAGRPVVASDIAGYRDLVRPGREGVLVPPRDPTALAAALVALLADPAARERMGRAGREAAAVYDWEHVAGDVLRYYRELVEPAAEAACGRAV